MSKYLSPAAGIAMVVWLAFWLWYLSGEYLSCFSKSLQQAPVFQLQHDKLNYSGQEVFSFKPSAAIPIITPVHHQFLKEVGRHLRTHPDLFLHLKGNSASFEKNITEFNELGLARAEALKSLLISAGAPPQRIFTESEQFDNLLSVEGKLYGAVQFHFSADDWEKPVSFKSFISSQKVRVQTLFFPEGRYELQEAKENAVQVLDSLVAQMSSIQKYKLLITGYSNSQEEKKARYNLAELRARAVRQYLLTHGLERQHVDMRFILHESPSRDFSKVELQIKE